MSRKAVCICRLEVTDNAKAAQHLRKKPKHYIQVDVTVRKHFFYYVSRIDDRTKEVFVDIVEAMKP